MSYYNHFALEKYQSIYFSEVMVGEKFRVDMFKGKRRRKYIVCIKTGDLSYQEFKNKKEHKLLFFHSDGFRVCHFSKLNLTDKV